MASDGGSDAVNLYLAFKVRKFGFDYIRYGTSIVVASGVAHIALVAVFESSVRKFCHLFGDALDNTLFGTDLLARN